MPEILVFTLAIGYFVRQSLTDIFVLGQQKQEDFFHSSRKVDYFFPRLGDSPRRGKANHRAICFRKNKLWSFSSCCNNSSWHCRIVPRGKMGLQEFRRAFTFFTLFAYFGTNWFLSFRSKMKNDSSMNATLSVPEYEWPVESYVQAERICFQRI